VSTTEPSDDSLPTPVNSPPVVDAPAPAAAPEVDGPTAEQIEQGKMWAILSYASMFVGFPVCVLPLAIRDNEFALYHARHATIVYLAAMVLSVAFVFIYLITCGIGILFLPLLFLLWVPTIHGFVLAAGGKMEEPMGLFGLGDKVFGSLQVVKKD